MAKQGTWLLNVVATLHDRAAQADRYAAEAKGEHMRLKWRGQAAGYRDSAAWLQECYAMHAPAKRAKRKGARG